MSQRATPLINFNRFHVTVKDRTISNEKIEIENNLNHTIDLGAFSNGIYSVRIVSTSSMKTFQFIKQ